MMCVLNCSYVNAVSTLVRVSVLREVDSLTIAVDGKYRLINPMTKEILSQSHRLNPTAVTLKNGQLRIGEKVYAQERVLVEPYQSRSLLSINKRHYRGSVLLINNGHSITAVNYLDLESYVKGVLYREISDQWPMEAIKAQAVATRTFAIYSMEKFADRDYDMTNDIYSQVYGGKTAERERTNKAVQLTKGEVLTYQGKIFPTFFHANSGGMTEDGSQLWDINIPPLKGNVLSVYSENSPHYRWKLNYRLKDIQDKLNELGFDLWLIKTLEVTQRTPTGRVKNILITTRDGKTANITGKMFREMMGPNIIRSLSFDIKMQGYYVDFIGKGWGHGVGLCQWGAYNMSLLKHSYKQILSFYYPSSVLKNLQYLK